MGHDVWLEFRRGFRLGHPFLAVKLHTRLVDLCTVMDTLLKSMDDLHSASLLSGANIRKGKMLMILMDQNENGAGKNQLQAGALIKKRRR